MAPRDGAAPVAPPRLLFGAVLLSLVDALELHSSQRSAAGSRADLQARAGARASVAVEAHSQLGVMSRAGVTRYKNKKIKKVKSESTFYWANAGGTQGRFGQSAFAGPLDLTDNISWGWHHPRGVYNTMPVGGPLVDADQNIYLASDDAIRKFDSLGRMIWSYGPRGQLAAAPSLVQGTAANSSRRDGGGGAKDSEQLLRLGDVVEALPGKEYISHGKEYYRAGDVGRVTKIVASDTGQPRAIIKWDRTGHGSSALLASWQHKFMRASSNEEEGSGSSHSSHVIQPSASALYGSTTTGYAFAIDIETGEELWATKVCGQISGVKGSVGAKGSVMVLASDRCTNRYCYRYRNETMNMMPSNSVVRALSSMDGSPLWTFKPDSPVWNFVPHLTPDDTVLFQDFEGTVYCLELAGGTLVWKQEGQIGMYTQAAALYSSEIGQRGMVYSITETGTYASRWCSPYRPPGILSWCNTIQSTPGLVRGYDAVTGQHEMTQKLPMPPTGAALGKLAWGGGFWQIIVGMGLNCKYVGAYGDASKPSKIWAMDARGRGMLWQADGPTLWTEDCAGDREGADVRRAMGIREKCQPNSWTAPVVDSNGDLYIGSHIGELQKYTSPDGTPSGVELTSTLKTGAALVDQAIAMSPGMMVVATCNAMIVLAED